MHQVLASLLILATCTLAPPPSPGLLLRYRPLVGQTVTYQASMEMRGKQILLDEHRPVNVRAEVEVTEQVLSVEPDGSFSMRVSARAVSVSDPSGTFAAGQHGEWPVVEIRVSALGEMLEVKAMAETEHLGPLQRAFSAGLPRPALVVLPARPVAVGDAWEWREGDARQTSRLVSVSGGDRPVARLASTGRELIHLEEGSPGLGLTTRVNGQMSNWAETDLLIATGLVTAQKGEMWLKTRGETTLRLPQGPRTFPLQSDLRVRFRITLAGREGQPVLRSEVAPPPVRRAATATPPQ